MYWKTHFAEFLAEVPFEKRSTDGLTWTESHDKVIALRYGKDSIEGSCCDTGEKMGITGEEVQQLMAQARRMVIEYYSIKPANEETQRRHVRKVEAASVVRV